MKLLEHEIDAIVCDSRKARAGSAFVCLCGAKSDGHNFAPSAYRQGCRVFVCMHRLDLPSDAAQMIVPDTRIALAELSAAFYQYPARQLKLIGITGTKGKSTVSSLIADILNAAGHKTAMIGTTGITVAGRHTATENSTPESLVLHRTFAEALSAGCEYVVMEVSSQAYKMHRVYGIYFDAAIFTNLSPDHIGPEEHADYAEYRCCKGQLFENAARSFFNADDPESAYMEAHATGTISTYGIVQPADLHADDVQSEWRNGRPGMSYLLEGIRYHLSLPGEFNVSNALAATAVCEYFGVSRRTIARVLEHAQVCGRFERVGALPGREFIIDYAHNGLSLYAILSVLRGYRPKRLICLFGSVGERTQIRRRELAEAARAFCDLCILTADNPDHEPPMQIIHDIAEHLGDCPYVAIPDRAEAISFAVTHSCEGDIVLFAGKGHETYQLIDGQKIPFCERDLILQAIAFMQREAEILH